MENGAPPASREDYAAMVGRFLPAARLVAVVPLVGGQSAETVRLDVAFPDGTVERLVSRRHGDVNFALEPAVAANEFRLLARLHAAGLPVQAPRHVDRDGVFAARPCVVLSHIDGAVPGPSDGPATVAATMADTLARIHAVGADGFGFLHRLDDDLRRWLATPGRAPDESMSETRLRTALARTPQPECAPTLLHGDFWPGNLLWRDGAIVGVIDWEDATIGPPHADLAVARLELLWAFGEPAMMTFTDRYHATTGLDRSGQPYWDLYAALRAAGRLGSWGFTGDAEVKARVAHSAFVEAAFAAL